MRRIFKKFFSRRIYARDYIKIKKYCRGTAEKFYFPFPRPQYNLGAICPAHPGVKSLVQAAGTRLGRAEGSG